MSGWREGDRREPKLAGFLFRHGTIRLAGLLGWQVIASTLLVMLGAVALGLPPWVLGVREFGWIGLMGVAYLASTLVPSGAFLQQQSLPVPAVLLITCAVFALVWAFSPVLDAGWVAVWPFLSGHIPLNLLQWSIPTPLLLISLGFSVLANTMLTRIRAERRWALLTFSCLAVFLVIFSMPGIRAAWLYRAMERPLVYETDASHHRLRIRYFRDRFPSPTATGGALAVVDDGLLLMTGDGWLYRLRISHDGERLKTDLLLPRVPLNAKAFMAAHPHLSAFQKSWFRASDLLVSEAPGFGAIRLLASHHYFHAQRSCYTVRVSELMLPRNELRAGSQPGQWRTLHEVQPCLPLYPSDNFLFAGHQTGAALLRMEPHKVLLALGDGGFDGIQAEPAVSQDASSEFGKIIELDLRAAKTRIVTSGHRSPGGLHKDAAGRVWLTEHGPRGGDELNRIRVGRNYGWPLSTLGAQYGQLTWPGQDETLPPGQFEIPVFAWTPSIATADLISLEGSAFHHWQGDLIVATLANRSVHRVHLSGDVPILSERIRLFERVRGLVQDTQGRIVFWTDRSVIGLIDAVE